MAKHSISYNTAITARNELMEAVLSNLRQSRAALAELASIWQKTDGSSFWWDNHRRVLCTAGCRDAYRRIFGSYGTLRSLANVNIRKGSLKSQIKLVLQLFSPRRWDGPIDIGLSLPKDAVLIPPKGLKRGMVIVSPTAGIVLKLNYGRAEVDREIGNWNIVKSAGIDHHVPRLLDYGSTKDAGQWMVTEIAPNTDPIDRPLNPLADKQRIWRHWLRWKIMPVMGRFYEAAGLEVLDADDVFSSLRKSFVRDKMPDPLFKVLALAENVHSQSEKKKVVITTLHKDILPEHIHRSGENWWLLDWGSIGRGLTCKEVFRNYFWTRVSEEENNRAFWAWLRGEVGIERFPENLRAEIEVYVDWYTAWRKETMDVESLRCQLLISLLNDYRQVITEYNLRDRLMNLENCTDVPNWVRSLLPQLRALNAC